MQALKAQTPWHKEKHRPQVHFTPRANWMNDPNGMVYHKGTYHLFYQYYPDSTVWGPMHWGHATSSNLIYWQHQPVALYPDSLGYIFSGSAVIDVHNTSGFGKNGKAPLVAIFTHHYMPGEKEGRKDFQYQSIAYSNDDGKSWTKYAGNPVLKNPGIRDFRDPKVMWHAATKRWVMTLATLDRVSFYSSPNLKDWRLESDFGQNLGAHGGVWECPDLFPLYDGAKEIWVLLVSLNPGGPNGGSATQYFTGSFDGNRFTAFDTLTRWLDYGPDNYAGVTWHGTGRRTIFMGWMSNWQYAQQVPTQRWRSAMTLPRDLLLKKETDGYRVASLPVPELAVLHRKPLVWQQAGAAAVQKGLAAVTLNEPVRVVLRSNAVAAFNLVLFNKKGQQLTIGYDAANRHYFIDRSRSGNTGFEKGFAGRHLAPRLTKAGDMDLVLVIDQSSVELFADGGLSVMTEIFFPDEPFSQLRLDAAPGLRFNTFSITPLQAIHKTKH